MHKFPKLLQQIQENNELELERILEVINPWMKLNLKCPVFDNNVIRDSIYKSVSWRKLWKENDDYETKWLSDILFGPSDWDEWMELIKDRDKTIDFNHLPKIYRNKIKFGWTVDSNNPIRQWINSWIDDQDIYMIYTYVLEPGGYVAPHIDSIGKDYVANKLYIPLVWDEGNTFSFNGFGDLPTKQGDVWLLNNRTYAHWAINNSQSDRVVLNIDCNFNAISKLIKESFLQR